MLTDKHASSSAITFDITGNVVFTVGSFVSLIWCEVLFVFPLCVIVFLFNWTIELLLLEN